MNYRHDFHAGNFADVLKHIFLTRILLYLRRKPAAFRFIDTHAGSGVYDLAGPEAQKTGEWRGGIGKVLTAKAAPDVTALIEPYLHIAASLMAEVPPHYPGSGLIAKSLLRQQDRMALCELHPLAFASLKANFRGERRVRLIAKDGYMGLRAFIPPTERRGLALIDPPFEERDEFERVAEAITLAWNKWPSGVYMLWYPVKDAETASAFAENLVSSDLRKVLRLELQTGPPAPDGPLARCGVIIINPPFTLYDEARLLLPWLAQTLGGEQPGFMIEWLIGE